MRKIDYLALRNKMYSAVGTLGTHAEETEIPYLQDAYSSGCIMLDDIDCLGVKLGYIDAETNEVKE